MCTYSIFDFNGLLTRYISSHDHGNCLIIEGTYNTDFMEYDVRGDEKNEFRYCFEDSGYNELIKHLKDDYPNYNSMEMLIKEEFDFSNKFGDLHKYALSYGIKHEFEVS